MPDTFITQHTLGSVSSIQDLEAFKGSPQPERSSEHGSQTRPRAQRGEATSSQVCCLWQHGAPRGDVRHRGSSSDPAVAKQAGGCIEDQESEGEQATTSPKGWEPPCPCPLHVHRHLRPEGGPGETGSRVGAAKMFRQVRGGLAEAAGVRGCGEAQAVSALPWPRQSCFQPSAKQP